ncbi:aminoglycoside phosphotransferase [Longispora fulva]|uniref:Ser/Thr protein kinase RdoA (MazF antagonist) n=1 Tax=Longispora fulva TaxID=619741 RepID=A0A8J7KFD6_9ACTN|nr:aminoglycoside phosphotransferase family protein [Longispora fulva]MBG6136050.1 Ser/Thr protein kinase RdoA (MazF antagonist) [Longispora fulva]GIG55708.1 aminoglycoside phosphotransferase [Longispora fulva]
MIEQARTALLVAAEVAGLDPGAAELIRHGQNTLFRLPGAIVARVARPGQQGTAAKETRVSQWLAAEGVPVVRVVEDLEQPVAVNGRAVTFWHELPPHRPGSALDVAGMLRRLHTLIPPPELDLPRLEPLTQLADRIDAAATVTATDRAWLHERLAALRERYAALPEGMAWCAVHGDAWGSNIAITAAGPVVLDLERFAVGPPEWDLTAVAVDHFTFGSVTTDDWDDFCRAYGCDVTTWDGYPVLRDIRELRKLTFATQMAIEYPDRPRIAEQVQIRLACLRGEEGPRPWRWAGVP